MIVEVVSRPEDLAAATADHFVEAARAAIAERGVFHVCLAGGNTPKAAYRLLAVEPRSGRVDWSKVHVFWGDERNVSPDDPNSNEGMGRDAFLNTVPIPERQIHPIYNGGSAIGAANSYAKVLRAHFASGGPSFDLLLLGMGADGHTASLFPGDKSLKKKAWVVTAETETLAVRERITLTPAILCRSRLTFFAVGGSDKSARVREVLEEDAELPAGILARCCPNVTWLLDSAAASELKTGEW